MSLRINNNSISKIRINSSNIKFAKINGEIVFQLENATIKVTFTDKTIKAISDTTGSYDFYYANDNGIINDYDKIVSFNLTANVTSSYTYLNSFNVAPYNATKIAVCKSGTTKILSSYLLPSQFLFDSSTYGNKLYSFGALSDVHIDGDGNDEASASSDLVRALNFFNSTANLVSISGDLTVMDGYAELSTFKDLVDANSTIPVYASRGNHDCRYTGGSLYFEQSYQNDKFIFLGMNTENYGDSCFTTEEIDWLENKLETYKNQRVFLFFHVFMPDTCGNINNLYPYSSLDTSSSIVSRFVTMMTKYKNVIYFSGHSHLEFACQKFGANANIFSNGTTCHRVHIPSCAKPLTSSITYNRKGSEGYLVDVYENCIVLRGRDFEKGKFLPIANYLLDTTIKKVTDNNLLKLLQANAEWVSYAGTEASATFNSDNTLTITADGSSSWGLNITQNDLTLSAGKTYKFSCDNIGSSTWISLDNDNNMMLTSSKSYVDITPTQDITISKLVIWVKRTVYDNVVWNIKLEEIS